MDGVLADLNGYVIAELLRHYPLTSEEIEQLRLLQSCQPHHRLSDCFEGGSRLKQIAREITLKEEIFYNLKPLEGGIEFVREMSDFTPHFYFCTSNLSSNPHCAPGKMSWVRKHLGDAFVKKLIITKNKFLVKGDVLIDDAPSIKGEDVSQDIKQEWTRVIFDQPYNQGTPGLRMSWATWKNVLVFG